jgi:hypothetical protein
MMSVEDCFYGVARCTAGFVGSIIPIASRCLMPQVVANFMGSHAMRANFEHAAEGVLIPIMGVGFFELINFLIGEDKFDNRILPIVIASIWGLFQIMNESFQADNFTRALQTDQLFFTGIGLVIGVGVFALSKGLEAKIRNKSKT